jgi:hypothetical protein
MITDGESGKMCEEEFFAYFKVPSQYLRGGTEEIPEKTVVRIAGLKTEIRYGDNRSTKQG